MNSEESRMITSCTEAEEDRHRQYAMLLASASVLPMVLKAAMEMGVLEIIERAGPGALLSSYEIASYLPAHTNSDASVMLDRILRLLASYSVLTCSLVTDHHHAGGHQVQRLYGLAPVSKYFIRNQDGVSLAPLLNLIQDKVMINMWDQLRDAVMEGGLAFNRAYGMNAAEYVSKDDKLHKIFKGSMSDYNAMFMKKILETHKGFEGLKSLVDVGGGDGSILNMIISRYPSVKGINFDLAPVIERAPSYPGIERVAGDMFASVPRGDAVFMKWVLHSWDDEHCLKLLKNCYEALPDYGKVMVVDLVIPEAPETSPAVKSMFQFDLFMMNMNPGGKERTEREFESLAREAGFSSIQVVCCAYNFSLIEFYKRMPPSSAQ